MSVSSANPSDLANPIELSHDIRLNDKTNLQARYFQSLSPRYHHSYDENSNGHNHDTAKEKLVLQTLKSICQTQDPTKIVELNLDGNSQHLKYRLRRITGLHNMMNLKILNLSHNDIQKIENLNTLKNLHELDLSFNKIAKLENISALKHLEILDISNNLLEEIPPIIAKNTNLTTLNLSVNLISDKGSITNLKTLSKLAVLNLSNNPVCEVSGYHNTVLHALKKLLLLDENPTQHYLKLHCKLTSHQEVSAKNIRPLSLNNPVEPPNSSRQIGEIMYTDNDSADLLSARSEDIKLRLTTQKDSEVTQPTISSKSKLQELPSPDAHGTNLDLNLTPLNPTARGESKELYTGLWTSAQLTDENEYQLKHKQRLSSSIDSFKNQIEQRRNAREEQRDNKMEKKEDKAKENPFEQIINTLDLYSGTHKETRENFGAEKVDKSSKKEKADVSDTDELSNKIKETWVEIKKRYPEYQKLSQVIETQKEVILDLSNNLTDFLQNKMFSIGKITLRDQHEITLLNEKADFLNDVRGFLGVTEDQTEYQVKYFLLWSQINKELDRIELQGYTEDDQASAVIDKNEPRLDNLLRHINEASKEIETMGFEICTLKERINDIDVKSNDLAGSGSDEGLFNSRWEIVYEKFYTLLQNLDKRKKLFADLKSLYSNMSKMAKTAAKLRTKEFISQKNTENSIDNYQVVSNKKEFKLSSENSNRKSQTKASKEKSSLTHFMKPLKDLHNIQRDIENKENIPDYFGFQDQHENKSKDCIQKESSTCYTPYRESAREVESNKEHKKIKSIEGVKGLVSPRNLDQTKTCQSCEAKDNLAKMAQKGMIKACQEKAAYEEEVIRLQEELEKTQKELEAQIRCNEEGFVHSVVVQSEDKGQLAKALVLLSELCNNNAAQLDEIKVKIISSTENAGISPSSPFQWLVNMQSNTIEGLLKTNKELQKQMDILVTKFGEVILSTPESSAMNNQNTNEQKRDMTSVHIQVSEHDLEGGNQVNSLQNQTEILQAKLNHFRQESLVEWDHTDPEQLTSIRLSTNNYEQTSMERIDTSRLPTQRNGLPLPYEPGTDKREPEKLDESEYNNSNARKDSEIEGNIFNGQKNMMRKEIEKLHISVNNSLNRILFGNPNDNRNETESVCSAVSPTLKKKKTYFEQSNIMNRNYLSNEILLSPRSRQANIVQGNQVMVSNLQENIAQHLVENQKHEASKHLRKISNNIQQYKEFRERTPENSKKALKSNNLNKQMVSPNLSRQNKISSVPMMEHTKLLKDCKGNARESLASPVYQQRTRIDYAKVFRKPVCYSSLQKREGSNLRVLLNERKGILESHEAANYHERFDLNSPNHPKYYDAGRSSQW